MEQNNENATTAGGSNGEQKKAADESGVPTYTEAQLARKIKCRTYEGKIVEVPWHLMMQAKTFMNMWETLEIEEEFDQQQAEENAEPFIFQLGDITSVCFEKILEWMEHRKRLPEPVVQVNPITQERIWFPLTDWERNYFDVDFEVLKEYFMAANFLKVNSLYIYCSQECARAISNARPEKVRDMLGLGEPTEEDIRATNDVLNNVHYIHIPNQGAAGNGGQQPPAANGNDP